MTLACSLPHANSWSTAGRLRAWVLARRGGWIDRKLRGSHGGSSLGNHRQPLQRRASAQLGPPSRLRVTGVWILASERRAPSSCVATGGPPSPEQLACHGSGWVVFKHGLVFPGTGEAPGFVAARSLCGLHLHSAGRETHFFGCVNKRLHRNRTVYKPLNCPSRDAGPSHGRLMRTVCAAWRTCWHRARQALLF